MPFTVSKLGLARWVYFVLVVHSSPWGRALSKAAIVWGNIERHVATLEPNKNKAKQKHTNNVTVILAHFINNMRVCYRHGWSCAYAGLAVIKLLALSIRAIRALRFLPLQR